MRTRITALSWLALLGLTAGCSFDNAAAPTATVPLSARTSVALGNGFSCGVTTSHAAYCWGRNEGGQGGNGSTFWSGFPTLVSVTDPIAAVSASEASVCALTTTGTVDCWGLLPSGEAAAATRATPVTVVSPVQLVSLTVGGGFACGLDKDGLAYCWGVNRLGQLGVGDTLPRSAPVAVIDGLKFTQISAGYAHACGTIAGGTTYCWGDNAYGESGISTHGVKRLLEPTPVETTVPMTSVTAGTTFSCGVAQGGLGYCWGDNGAGQLGDGSQTSRAKPAQIAGSLHFTSLSANRGNSFAAHACGVTTNHAVYCWGANALGETGGPSQTACISTNIATVCDELPVSVRKLGSALAVDVGTYHSCAITTAGGMACWGDNSYGELGDGTTTKQTTPFTLSGQLHFH